MRKYGKRYLRPGRQGLRLGRKNIFLSQILTDLEKNLEPSLPAPITFPCLIYKKKILDPLTAGR